MINYGKQSIDEKDIQAVTKALNSDWLTQGPKVEKFESDLKDYFGANHVCAVTNGTAALHLTGLALGWKPGDIVITSPLTFLATANCIVYAGATPDFVDIDPMSYTIDPNKVEEKVKYYSSIGENIKAIIGIDFAGHPCDWKSLREIANKYDLQLVNDNCHAMGAKYLGDKQYAVKYADIVTQSYHPVKHLTTGEGGAILTNNSDFDEIIRGSRSHGMTKDSKLMHENDGPWYYEMHKIGFNYRITDFQCALGSSQLKKLDGFVKNRRKIANKYDKLLFGIKYIKTPLVQNTVDHSYHLYPLQIDFEMLALTKIDFFSNMKKAGINLQVHYIPVHFQPFYKDNYGFKKGDYPISESFYQNEISLPIYPDLSSSDQQSVLRKIEESINE